MRRPIVISLCIMNACIAAGLLWFVFGSNPKQTAAFQQPVAEQLTDAERWEHAESAKSFREAFFHLSRFEDRHALSGLTTHEIDTLSGGIQLRLDRWPFYQAVLQTHANNAKEEEALLSIRRIASETEQALTLRDTAFRSYVENAMRISPDLEAGGDAFALIDALFEESNSLAETALQAEHFLAKKGAVPLERKSIFRERLLNAVSDTNRPEGTRITALNMLRENDSLYDLPLVTLYPDAGVRLQTAILQSLANLPTSEPKKVWLEEIRPVTPEQEQLRLRILGQ